MGLQPDALGAIGTIDHDATLTIDIGTDDDGSEPAAFLLDGQQLATAGAADAVLRVRRGDHRQSAHPTSSPSTSPQVMAGSATMAAR